MDSEADRLAMLQAVGDSWVYFDGETTTAIYGVFRNAYQRVDSSRGPASSSSRPEIEITLDQIASPKQGDKLYRGSRSTFVGEFDYVVVSARPDESEHMATLVLKAIP